MRNAIAVVRSDAWIVSRQPATGGARLRETSVVGAKAASLAQLPEAWSPVFFVLTTDAYVFWLQGGGPAYIDVRDDANWIRLREQIQSTLRSLGFEHLPRVIVRSSAARESLDDRGRYESVHTRCNPDAVLEAAFGIWADFAKQHQSPAAVMAIIVQAAIAPTAAGHLSNERRVSRTSYRWLCEIDDTLQKRAKHVVFRTSPDHVSSASLILNCNNAEELRSRLQSLAQRFTKPHQRYHFEWL